MVCSGYRIFTPNGHVFTLCDFQDVVGLLLDVGPSMGAEDRDGESCLERCKNILSMYVQRKVSSSNILSRALNNTVYSYYS